VRCTVWGYPAKQSQLRAGYGAEMGGRWIVRNKAKVGKNRVSGQGWIVARVAASQTRSCQTKPICPGGQAVCSAHPTSGDRRAKQSQFGTEVSRLKCEVLSSTAALGVVPAGGGWATWLLARRAEQSQFGTGVSSLKCEVSSGADQAAEDKPSCQTKPIYPGGKMVWTAHPARAADSVEQTQFGPGALDCGVGIEGRTATMTNGACLRNKAKFRQDGASRKRRTLAGGEPRRRPEHAKQSQSWEESGIWARMDRDVGGCVADSIVQNKANLPGAGRPADFSLCWERVRVYNTASGATRGCACSRRVWYPTEVRTTRGRKRVPVRVCGHGAWPSGGMADAGDLKSPARKGVWVRIPSRPLGGCGNDGTGVSPVKGRQGAGLQACSRTGGRAPMLRRNRLSDAF
jgi:hypothetical protein